MEKIPTAMQIGHVYQRLISVTKTWDEDICAGSCLGIQRSNNGNIPCHICLYRRIMQICLIQFINKKVNFGFRATFCLIEMYYV